MEKKLRYHLLPAQLLIKNSVIGEPCCNYELYMIELVNASIWFREKVNFKSFLRPESEAHGECDCYAGSYGLDFKLTASQTRLRACSELSDRTVVGSGGTFSRLPPKKSEAMTCTVLHVALKAYDLDGLNRLRESSPKENSVEADVKTFIEKLEIKKNLLLYYPHEFYYKSDREFNDSVKDVADAINASFSAAMQYRVHYRPEYETYMGFIYDGFFVIMQLENGKFRVIDQVNTEKSPIYMRLKGYAGKGKSSDRK